MSNNSPPQSCQKCGNPRVRQGKYCIICGTQFSDSEGAPETTESEITKDSTVHTATDAPSQAETTPSQRTSFIRLDQGISLLKSLRKNLAVILIGVGAISIIGAIGFTLLMLLPKEIISDLEVPPIEGMIFDLFVIFGLLAFLIKEGVVMLGYLPKKGTLDRWFSFVLLLIYWINLVTFSIGLVEKSILFDLGVSFELIFIILTVQTIVPSFLYFRRFVEYIFSGILSINLVSALYLFQWITPVNPTLYTIAVYVLIALVLLIALKSEDIVPFTGVELLLPLIFLSPYLLSNSVVILVLVALNLFPFIDNYLRNHMNQEKVTSVWIQTIGWLISPLGIITTSFAFFYGYLETPMVIILFAIPVVGFISLKLFRPSFRRNQGINLIIIAFLVFTNIFLDLSVDNGIVLLGVTFLLTIQTIVFVFEHMKTEQEKNLTSFVLLLLISLIIVSLTKVDFIWKILMILLPLLVLFYQLLRKNQANHLQVQLIVFGSVIVFLLSFIRTPLMDWIIIPISLIIALLGLSTLVFYNQKTQDNQYSRDITIFSIIFEIILLVVMFWTRTSIEMLYPVIILILFAGVLLFIQAQRRVTDEFRWINASFLVCFGLMTFWNEFDETITLITTFLLILPIVIDLIQSKGMEKSLSVAGTPKIFNLNLTLSGIGLSLIIFFEEFSPINHSFIYLIVIITWLGMYFSARNKLGVLSALTILTLPGIIFFFELLLHETVFTPITEMTYLFLMIIVLVIPAIILQMDESLLKRDTTKIVITPIVLGTTVITLLTILAFQIYDFNQLESSILIIGISIGILISTLFTKYLYESGLLLIISSVPPLFYLIYVDTLSYMFYLLPLLPILVNLIIGFQYFKTSLNIRLQELIVVFYLILFVLFNPLQPIIYSTALVSVFLFSWQSLGLIKREQNKTAFILANTINSGFVFGLTLLLEPLPMDLYVLEIPFSFILVFVYVIIILLILSTVLLFLYWQFKEIKGNFSFLMALTLIFNCSAVIITYFALLTKYTDLVLGDIMGFILILTIVLSLLFLLVYILKLFVKSQISSACLYVTTIWLIISSTHSPNIETVFLWIFFAPIFMIVYFTKRDKNIGFLGLILYLIAGMQLLTHLLDFLILGDTEWLTILGLIVYGIEMVTLGIYTSIAKKSNHELVLLEKK